MAPTISAVPTPILEYSCGTCSKEIKGNNISDTAFSCLNCNKVHYCTPEHQLLDLETHKNSCFPFLQESNNQFGNFLTCTRPIKEGEIFFEEIPIIIAPRANELGNDAFPAVCLDCCHVLNGSADSCQQVCPKCSWPLCCTSNCKNAHLHVKFECEVFRQAGLTPTLVKEFLKHFDDKSLNANIIYESIQILRFLLLSELEPVNGKWTQLLSLESEYEMRLKSPTQFMSSKFIVQFIQHLCQLEKYSEDLIIKLCGMANINDFSLEFMDNSVPILENRIHDKISRLIHSCTPNVSSIPLHDGPTRLQALTDIQPGQMLTLFYEVDFLLFKDIVERRKYLKERYNFWCKCKRCSDPTELGTFSSAIKCQRSHHEHVCDGYFLPLDSLNSNSAWACNAKNCDEIKTYEVLREQTLEKLKFTISNAVSLNEQINVLKAHSSKSVHENHVLLMELRYKILSQLSGQEIMEDLRLEQSQIISKCIEVQNKLQLGSTFLKELTSTQNSEPVEELVIFSHTKENQMIQELEKDLLHHSLCENTKPGSHAKSDANVHNLGMMIDII